MVKAIIPCAGYGTRMGMAIDQSKEMLDDPVTHKVLIDYSLDLCYKYKIEPIIISRSEKWLLNGYFRNTNKQVDHIILNQPGKEWPQMVLTSQGLWGEKNILILPDTRFDEKAFEEIVNKISEPKSSLVIGYHNIDPKESPKWGTVTNINDTFIEIDEKPKEKQSDKAWGILAFEKYTGKGILNSIVTHQKYHTYYGNSESLIDLKWFKDITRSGTLEKY